MLRLCYLHGETVVLLHKNHGDFGATKKSTKVPKAPSLVEGRFSACCTKITKIEKKRPRRHSDKKRPHSDTTLRPQRQPQRHATTAAVWSSWQQSFVVIEIFAHQAGQRSVNNGPKVQRSAGHGPESNNLILSPTGKAEMGPYMTPRWYGCKPEAGRPISTGEWETAMACWCKSLSVARAWTRVRFSLRSHADFWQNFLGGPHPSPRLINIYKTLCRNGVITNMLRYGNNGSSTPFSALALGHRQTGVDRGLV